MHLLPSLPSYFSLCLSLCLSLITFSSIQLIYYSFRCLPCIKYISWPILLSQIIPLPLSLPFSISFTYPPPYMFLLSPESLFTLLVPSVPPLLLLSIPLIFSPSSSSSSPSMNKTSPPLQYENFGRYRPNEKHKHCFHKSH